MKNYIIALDQGTTSSRALLIDKSGSVRGVAQSDFPQYFPHPGWVEHNPKEILSSQLSVLTELLVSQRVTLDEIDSIGITNQRETTIVWDRHTGEPVYNALVWQCRRTTDLVEQVCGNEEIAAEITRRTGLIPDAYYSASKIAWILNEVDGARERAEAGDLLFGTVDTWLIWNLTQGAVHATDPTNASRTMLFDIHTGQWDPWLCGLFGVPMSMLAEVRPSSSYFGNLHHPVYQGEVPICGVAGDQQAALFGQGCLEEGQAKATFGTGCFLLMHTGGQASTSTHGLVTTRAASLPDVLHFDYALEGSVFMAGALMQWLRDGLGLVSDVAQSNELAQSVPDTNGVYVVPAFTGLGAPYWDSEARGAIYGLTRGANKCHLVRACLEAQAYQVYDVLRAMIEDSAVSLSTLMVDGGACRNDFMMQFCADILQVDIIRPSVVETTALGAAFLAGLSSGFWQSQHEIALLRSIDRTFHPSMDLKQRDILLRGWKEAIYRTQSHHPSL